MNFNHLYYFYMVAKYRGMSEAARKLNLGQPALSSQIKTFEIYLGKKLFERAGRNIKLTEIGQALFFKAQMMFEIAQQIERSTEMGNFLNRTSIRIGVSTEIERPYCVKLVREIHSKFKPSESPVITLLSDKTQILSDRLLGNEFDALITNNFPSKEGLKVLKVIDLPVHFILHSKFVKPHLRAKVSTHESVFNLLDEMQLGFAMPAPGMVLRYEIDEFFARNKYSHNLVFESDHLATVSRAVVDKVGVSLLPIQYMKKELSSRQVTSFGPAGGYWKHHIYLIVKTKQFDQRKTNIISDAFDKLAGD